MMPNGHLPPAPELRRDDPDGPLHMWLIAAMSVLHSGHAELKAEIAALAVLSKAKDRQQAIQQGREDERRDQKERGEKRLGRWKLRFETIAVLIGVAAGAFSLGGIAAAIVFG